MANVLVDESVLKAVADKIREKTGETTKYKPSQFATAIERVYTVAKTNGSIATGVVSASSSGDKTLNISHNLSFEPKELIVMKREYIPSTNTHRIDWIHWKETKGMAGQKVSGTYGATTHDFGELDDLVSIEFGDGVITLTSSISGQYYAYFLGDYIWIAYGEEQE